jgi:electron-transferring-flavoprotein dehydrogenase
LLEQYGPRESMEYDVVIVGAGPAGLATAIRLKQLAIAADAEVSVVVLEKGSEPGAHILSGAIMDPIALTELIPDWKDKGAPLNQPVTEDEFLFLSETGARTTPHGLLPGCFKNDGNYIVSLGEVTRWLAAQAEELGVEIFPGFAAAEVLYADDGTVRGIATGHMGLGKDGEPTESFQLGMELLDAHAVAAHWQLPRVHGSGGRRPGALPHQVAQSLVLRRGCRRHLALRGAGGNRRSAGAAVGWASKARHCMSSGFFLSQRGNPTTAQTRTPRRQR